MSLLISKSLAGPAYIVLNVIRALNIIALLMVATASILMLVKTIVVSQFFFFDGCSHVISACISSKSLTTLLLPAHHTAWQASALDAFNHHHWFSPCCMSRLIPMAA